MSLNAFEKRKRTKKHVKRFVKHRFWIFCGSEKICVIERSLISNQCARRVVFDSWSTVVKVFFFSLSSRSLLIVETKILHNVCLHMKIRAWCKNYMCNKSGVFFVRFDCNSSYACSLIMLKFSEWLKHLW